MAAVMAILSWRPYEGDPDDTHLAMEIYEDESVCGGWSPVTYLAMQQAAEYNLRYDMDTVELAEGDLEVLGSMTIGDGEGYGDGEMGSSVFKIRLEKQEVK
jgi:hypothetical protein